MKRRWDAAAVLLGLSTHWKIYPIIYGVGCLGAIGHSVRDARNAGDFLRNVINAKTIRFTLISATTFLLLGLGCYAMYAYTHPLLTSQPSTDIFIIQLGVPIPLRIIPLPPPPPRPPAQLLALLLPHLPDLRRRPRAAREPPTARPALAAHELRAANGTGARSWALIWQAHGRPPVRVVRADGRVRRVQQGVHLTGTYPLPYHK